MSGYPYNNQPGINPTPPQPGYYPPPTGQPGYPGSYPAPSAPYVGFNPYAVPGQPGPVPGQPPISAMSYPGLGTAPPNVAPAPAYGYPGYPNVTPQQPSYPMPIEWIPTSPNAAHSLIDKAVVAGYEGHDGSPLWVIRARYEGDLIPGKLAIKHQAAYVPWGGHENAVHSIEVCCARPERVRWVEARDGYIPPNAVAGGNTAEGETLFIGRAKEQGSLTPGKVHPSHKTMYMSFAGKEVPHKVYEVLCTV